MNEGDEAEGSSTGGAAGEPSADAVSGDEAHADPEVDAAAPLKERCTAESIAAAGGDSAMASGTEYPRSHSGGRVGVKGAKGCTEGTVKPPPEAALAAVAEAALGVLAPLPPVIPPHSPLDPAEGWCAWPPCP